MAWLEVRSTKQRGVYGAELMIGFVPAGVDEMAWENPEFLAVIAAGNFGGLEADANINSPATCKNAITVGATLTVDQPGMAQAGLRFPRRGLWPAVS